MKKEMCVFAVLLTIALVGLFIRRPEKQEEDNLKHAQRGSQECSSTVVHVEAGDEESNKTNQEKELLPSPRVYKPISLQVGQGGATVVEIDHGLRPVDRFKGERYSDDVENGKRKGAVGAITLRVVDTTGTPVVGAKLFGGFWNNNPDDPPATGISDENGEISLEHLCTGDLNFSLTKDGYYKTVLRYWFFKTGFDCAKDGRWLPWNPTIEVVLKEKRNPIPMFVKRLQKKMPETGEPIGLDFEVGDLVHPYGKGKTADLLLHYTIKHGNDALSWHAETVYEMPNGEDGFYVYKSDTFSQLKSPYRAGNNVYLCCITNVFERTQEKIIVDTRNKETDIFIFRIRTENSDGTSNKNPLYGKMLLPDRLIDVTYYLNPARGDTDIEFDGTNNLFKADWRDTNWPREP